MPMAGLVGRRHKMNRISMTQIQLCTAKVDETFAMLIPTVAIHWSIHPSSQAFALAIRLKFRFLTKVLAIESNVFARTQLFLRARETSTTSSPSIFTTSSSTIQRRIPYVSSKYLFALRCAPLCRTLPNASVGSTCVFANPMNLLVSAVVWKVDNVLC